MRNKTQQDQTTKAMFGPEQGAFSIVQAAAYCGVRCAAVEDAIRDGRLFGRRFGRNIVIRKIDLDAFLAALDVIPPHTPPSILRRRQERSQQRTTTAATYLNERTVNAND
jgi:excisionase family DNA binding protein